MTDNQDRAGETAPLQALSELLKDIREAVAECRMSAGVPCQSEYAWHADEYEEWADRLDAALSRLSASQGDVARLREALELIANGGPLTGQRTGPMEMYQAQAVAKAALLGDPHVQ